MASLLTWYNRTRYTAVAPNSAANAITAIGNAVTANASKWVVSASAASYVELKANPANSPTGDLASARILIFGSVSPNSGALNASVIANTTRLYVCLCVDASTTGPVQAPNVGNPYTGKSRVILGETWCSAADATHTYVDIIESDDAIHIRVGAALANSCAGVTAGRIITDINGTARWGIFGTGSAALMTTASSFNGATMWLVSPAPAAAGTATGWSEIDSAGTIRPCGYAFVPHQSYGVANSLLTDGVDTALLPIFITRSRTFAVSAASQTYYGVARQMKWGPQASAGQVITVGGVTKAIASSNDTTSGTAPLWFSQV